MKLVVISLETDCSRELAVLEELFALGLERYHVRKPSWPSARLASWLREVPAQWHARIVLHSHHELVRELSLGGVHFRDSNPVGSELARAPNAPASGLPTAAEGVWASRSCHDLLTLRASLGRYDSVFFGPVFPSTSKPGYAPRTEISLAEVSSLLAQRSDAERRTAVLALGGITPARVPDVRALGFDGIAVIGAVWHAADPVRAFVELQESLCCHAA
jgi:thiamine-phosphate pyrophosphorylase